MYNSSPSWLEEWKAKHLLLLVGCCRWHKCLESTDFATQALSSLHGFIYREKQLVVSYKRMWIVFCGINNWENTTHFRFVSVSLAMSETVSDRRQWMEPYFGKFGSVSLTNSSRSIFRADDIRWMRIAQTTPHHSRDRRNQVHVQILVFGAEKLIAVIVSVQDIRNVIIKQGNHVLDKGRGNVSR